MFSSNLIKGFAIIAVSLFLIGCGGATKTSGGSARSTAPTQEQIEKLNGAQTSAEAAEKAYYDTKLERIELERQLEEQQ